MEIQFGKVVNHLDEIIKDKKLTQTKIVKTLGLEPKQLKLYRSQHIRKYDISIMERFCFLLDCEVGDILEYVPPTVESKQNG